jgi:hypothetical protein
MGVFSNCALWDRNTFSIHMNVWVQVCNCQSVSLGFGPSSGPPRALLGSSLGDLDQTLWSSECGSNIRLQRRRLGHPRPRGMGWRGGEPNVQFTEIAEGSFGRNLILCRK